MSNWNPAKAVYQCPLCGFRWRSLSLLWSWSYYCPWCGKLQSTANLVMDANDLPEKELEPEDENEKIPTVPGIKIPQKDGE